MEGGRPGDDEPRLLRGWVEGGLRAEFPALALRYVVAPGGARRSPRAVKDRLRDLAGRMGGAQAVNLRHQPIPWAYRVFYRHIGLDPDVQRTPAEELALERMRRGGFASAGLPADALAIATVEVGVALRAFDADRVEGRPGIRPSLPGEALAGRPGELPAGTLVIADEREPLGLLFGATATSCEVTRSTTATLLCAIQVSGVPDIAVEEALWLATGALRA
ncbi:MAG TPA: phenylalanine--tRNA ligase beta subunit-related protein [Solirubrobacterales bacterium]|jgi:DNA/RNA-binding domain of Phe-tRNA-synthetase-like protein